MSVYKVILMYLIYIEYIEKWQKKKCSTIKLSCILLLFSTFYGFNLQHSMKAVNI